MPKTTAQLNVLINRLAGPETQEDKRLSIIEIKVDELLASQDSAQRSIQRVIKETESYLKSGRDTLIMTSRDLVTGNDELSSLAIGSNVAEALVRVLQGIEVRPRYIIAKVPSILKITSTFSNEIINNYLPNIYRAGSHPPMRPLKAWISNEP